MIKISKEPPIFYTVLKVYELCYFCNKSTDTWNIKTNKPVCHECAKKYKTSELTKKMNKYYKII